MMECLHVVQTPYILREGSKNVLIYNDMGFGLHLGGWILSTSCWCKFGLECFSLYQDGFSLTWNSVSDWDGNREV